MPSRVVVEVTLPVTLNVLTLLELPPPPKQPDRDTMIASAKIKIGNLFNKTGSSPTPTNTKGLFWDLLISIVDAPGNAPEKSNNALKEIKEHTIGTKGDLCHSLYHTL
jgi:hypothetical protein